MSILIQDFFILISGKLFALFISLSYLVSKIVLRHILKTFVTIAYDIWDSIAWFAVDIAILNFSISIALRIPHKYNWNYEQTVVWYILLTCTFLISCVLYACIIKARGNQKKRTPLNSFRLFSYLSSSWCVVFFFLILIIQKLTQ